jgi:hypothetical protein
VPVPELRVSYVLNYVPCTIRVCLRVLTTCLIYVPSLRVFYVFPSTSWTTGRVLRAFYVFNYVTALYCVPCTCLTTWQPWTTCVLRVELRAMYYVPSTSFTTRNLLVVYVFNYVPSTCPFTCLNDVSPTCLTACRVLRAFYLVRVSLRAAHLCFYVPELHVSHVLDWLCAMYYMSLTTCAHYASYLRALTMCLLRVSFHVLNYAPCTTCTCLLRV